MVFTFLPYIIHREYDETNSMFRIMKIREKDRSNFTFIISGIIAIRKSEPSKTGLSFAFWLPIYICGQNTAYFITKTCNEMTSFVHSPPFWSAIVLYIRVLFSIWKCARRFQHQVAQKLVRISSAIFTNWFTLLYVQQHTRIESTYSHSSSPIFFLLSPSHIGKTAAH